MGVDSWSAINLDGRLRPWKGLMTPLYHVMVRLYVRSLAQLSASG